MSTAPRLFVGQLMLAVVVLQLGAGIRGVLLPYRAELDGFPIAVIGLLGTAYYAGFVAGCIFIPRLIGRIGHIRAFAGLAGLAAAGILGHGLAVAEPSWIILRVAVGFCFAGIYMTIESWLNDRASDETRGRVLATYLIVSWTGLIAGKLAFGLADPALLQPFALATLGICLAVGPVAFTTTPQPPQPEAGRIDLTGLFRRVPLALVGCALIGMANGAFWTLTPVFVAAGHEGHQAAGYFIALAILGGAAAQWPLGLVSDRADRRLVVVAVAVAAGLVGLALAWGGPGGTLIFLLAFGFGAAALPLYSICVAHANDRVEREHFVEVSSGLLMTFGAGAAAGPMFASLLIRLDGPSAVFLFTAGAHLALAAYPLARVLRQPSVPAEDRSAFVAVPKSTPAAIPLDPRVPAAPPTR